MDEEELPGAGRAVAGLAVHSMLVGLIVAATTFLGLVVREELLPELDRLTGWGVVIAVSAIAGGLGVGLAILTPLGMAHRRTTVRVDRLRRALDVEEQRQAFEAELDQALAQAEDEETVIDVIRSALERIDPDRPVELHLVERDRPLLALVFSTIHPDDDTLEPPATSPWESLAARRAQTLVYDSTDRLDVCPHLKSRVEGPCSAVAAPLMAMGRIIGVLYATGPNGSRPTERAVHALDMLALKAATRLAIVRAFENIGDLPAANDATTGLPTERVLRDRAHNLISDLKAFSVAVCDIDHFAEYNAQHGPEQADAALELLATTMNRVVRPTDTVGRWSSEYFLVIFPETRARDAARAVDRIREALILKQATAQQPAFTCSYGVADSTMGDSLDEILTQAIDACRDAKRQGRNRTVITDVDQTIDLHTTED